MAEPFESELEELVARHAQELAQEITSLLLRRLGIESPPSRGHGGDRPSARSSGNPPRARPRAESAARGPSTRKPRAGSAERAAVLDKVARAVEASGGMGLAEVERKTGLSRAVASSALKALKEEGRVFMGGSRRFARYAGSQDAADRASLESRGGQD